MDASEIDVLVQRLVANPHDQEALAYAHNAGNADPKSYAVFLEKVGNSTSDPAYASHWLSEAANVWSITLGDVHRAARVLMMAVDKDPTQETAAERLAQLYRDKGEHKALVALLERRAKALGPLAGQNPDLKLHLAGIHEELGRLWSEAPLSSPKKGVENYKRAIELDTTSAYAVYALRELYKQAEQWSDAELAEKLKSIPSKERQESWLRVARKPYTEEERAAARAKLTHELLDKMEAALRPSGWLVGKAYSIADIAATPFVKRIDEEIAPDEVTAAKHPRISEWWARIQARPAFARANFGPFLTS